MSYRPLVLVSGLTVGDYFLWSWSLNGNHAVLALVSGLTLPVLTLALLWLLAIGGARMVGALARGGAAAAYGRGQRRSARRASQAAPLPAEAEAEIAAGERSSGRLAA